MPAPKPALVAGSRVYLRRPGAGDRGTFIAATKKSAALHRGWVQAPTTTPRFDAYLRRFGRAENYQRATHIGVVVCRSSDDALVGVFNFSEIVRAAFQSSYLGYYAFSPLAGAGYMSEGLALVLRFAFRKLKLHRVEANVQPANAPSVALVRRTGFVREGYSRRYVKIGGRWRDHERWAILVEDWRARRSR